MIDSYPQRIVCLTEETTETLYLLGEQQRIVGISGFTVRPPEARKEKPKVSAFTSAKIEKILELRPDLVLGFSDIQADIAAELVRRGIEVHVFNQRSVAEILRMILMLGGMIGCEDKPGTLVDKLQAGLDAIRAEASKLPHHPRVYFEEWDNPQISCIAWVSELIGIAGGEDIFRNWRRNRWARIASSATPPKSFAVSRTLSSAPGAARNFDLSRWRLGPDGRRFPQCAPESCTK